MAASLDVRCPLTPADHRALLPTVAHYAARYARALEVSAEDLEQDAWLIIIEEVLPKYDGRTKLTTFASRVLGRLLIRRARCMALPVKTRVGHEGAVGNPKALRSRRDVHQPDLDPGARAGTERVLSQRVPSQLREEDFLELLLPDLDRAVLEDRILEAAVRAEARSTTEDAMARAVMDEILGDEVLREWAR